MMSLRHPRRSVSTRCLTVAMLVLTLGACASWRPVRPYPDFIRAAIEPGDKVTVTTHESDKLVFVVREISETTLVGDEHQVAFEDIQEIVVKSAQLPEYPCGGDVPLGCSVPTLAKAIEKRLMTYWLNNAPSGLTSTDETFHFDCVQHDFCYRHGFSTYAHDQKTCDDNFLDDMLDTCKTDPACLLLATQYHAAVSRKGHTFFRTDASTYCEYDGSPQNKAGSLSK
jgi:hypothetical protein